MHSQAQSHKGVILKKKEKDEENTSTMTITKLFKPTGQLDLPSFIYYSIGHIEKIKDQNEKEQKLKEFDKKAEQVGIRYLTRRKSFLITHDGKASTKIKMIGKGAFGETALYSSNRVIKTLFDCDEKFYGKDFLKIEASINNQVYGEVAVNSNQIMMPYLPGKPLGNCLYLFENDPIKYLDLIKKILLCYQQLHDKGVVHLDPNLDNLLIDEDENIRICDFGLSRFIGQKIFHHSVVKEDGAPELKNIVKGKSLISNPAQDIFSLGKFFIEFQSNFPASDIFFYSKLRTIFENMTKDDPEKRISLELAIKETDDILQKYKKENNFEYYLDKILQDQLCKSVDEIKNTIQVFGNQLILYIKMNDRDNLEKLLISTNHLSDFEKVVNFQDERGDTPLMIAASLGSIDTLKILLEQKANPLIKNKGVGFLDKICLSINKLIIKNDFNKINNIFLAYPEVIKLSFNDFRRQIINCISNNDINNLKNILIFIKTFKIFKEIDRPDIKGDNFLKIAALNGNLNAIKILLAEGAKQDFIKPLGLYVTKLAQKEDYKKINQILRAYPNTPLNIIEQDKKSVHTISILQSKIEQYVKLNEIDKLSVLITSTQLSPHADSLAKTAELYAKETISRYVNENKMIELIELLKSTHHFSFYDTLLKYSQAILKNKIIAYAEQKNINLLENLLKNIDYFTMFKPIKDYQSDEQGLENPTLTQKIIACMEKNDIDKIKELFNVPMLSSSYSTIGKEYLPKVSNLMYKPAAIVNPKLQLKNRLHISIC